MKKLKVGFISFAYRGHAAAYLHHMVNMNNVEIVGIADSNKTRVQPYIDQYLLPYYEDHHQLLETDVEAVIIMSENVFHAEMTIDAARAGKHILCEKPLGISVQEMKKMIATCEENKVQLMAVLPTNYSSTVVEAKKAIDRGEIGEIIAMKGNNRGSFPGGWYVDKDLAGGGAIMDHAVHIAGVMNLVTGSKVKSVYAEGGALLYDKEIDDAGIVHLTYENDVVAVLDPSWSRCKSYPFPVDLTLDIIGTEGVISIDCFNQKNEWYNDQTMSGIWDYAGDDNPAILIRDFVKALLEDEQVSTTGEDGLNAAVIAIAAYESIKQRRTVHISEISN